MPGRKSQPKYRISPTSKALAEPKPDKGNCVYCEQRVNDCSRCTCDRNKLWCGCADRPVTAGDPPSFQNIPKFWFANYRVNVGWDYLQHTLDRWQKDWGLNLDPDYQRAHCWDDDKRIAFIEYRLREGPSARELLFNCPTWDTCQQSCIELVDGKQRLTAALMFLNNEIPAFGHYFKEYSGFIGTGVDFIFHVNNLKTRKEVLKWYVQINAGGVVHTKEELDKVRKMLEEEQSSNG